MQSHHHQPQQQDTYQHQYYQAPSPSTSTSFPMPLPVYFRLHPHSNTPFPAKSVWLSILQTPSMAELRELAMHEHSGTVVHRFEGSITYMGSGSEDREVVLEVTDDDEVGAYLEHVRREGKGKATLIVLLGMIGAGGYI
jgi:hypothetical protein